MLGLVTVAAHDASVEGARAIKHETQGLLVQLQHAPHTKTPSLPGMPPAMISGRLAASIEVGEYDGDVAVGPTSEASSYNGPYPRIQELGGPSTGHPHMHWFQDGRWYTRNFRELLPRPFLEPATRAVIDSGELHQIYYDHWLRAITAVTR